MNKEKSQKADVCLILEGSYPYISGGVSQWAYDLIKSQKDLKFHLVCIIPPDSKRIKHYDIPSNVTGLTHIVVQKFEEGRSDYTKEEKDKFFSTIELPLLKLQHDGNLKDFQVIKDAIDNMKKPLGSRLLMNSEESWRMLLRMYFSTMAYTSFLNFFWSWRGIMGSFYSVMLAEIPEANVYHTLCTGYGGLFLARAHLETQKPCMITEHGIYTNERRVEIASANWLYDQKGMDLSIEEHQFERDLKDYWIDSFSGYSKLCYQAASLIITLFKENQEFQLADGASPSKLRIIPNGIDYERFSKIKREKIERPTIALIGRVVPIKDTKTFIHVINLLKKKIPNIHALIVGPTDEDENYYLECVDMVRENHLEKNVTFTGKLKMEEILNKVDLIVLTSISESQPLVILEAGAVGIPSVVTDVGACRELIQGKEDEKPNLGSGGAVCPLKDPTTMANEIELLLIDKHLLEQCGQSMKERVRKYYQKTVQDQTYHDIYHSLIDSQSPAHSNK